MSRYGPDMHLNRSEITSIQYFIRGSEDIRADSHAAIVKADTFKSDEPVSGGICSPKLGTMDYYYTCHTCRQNKDLCSGHTGHALLNSPLISPMYFVEVDKWLRVICHECGFSVYTEQELKKFLPLYKRLEEVNKGTKQFGRRCPNCDAPHPIIPKRTKVDATGKKEKHVRFTEYGDKDHVQRKRLYPWQIYRIFSRISNKTVILYGRDPLSHPSKIILNYLPIPSVTIRPDIKMVGSGGGKSSNDERTTQIHLIMKKNLQLAGINYDNVDTKTNNDLAEIQSDLDNHIKGKGAASGGGRGKTTLPSIGETLPRRGGRIREHLMAKRTVLDGRATIVGDRNIRIDQIGIPISFARTLYIKESVTNMNYKKMLKFFLNRKHTYPGCSKLHMKTDGHLYVVTDLDPNYQLQVGDILYRDLVEGDAISFNRQPSLRASGITTHYIVINYDPEMFAFRMNVLACVLYDADFDGDQMNIYGIYSKYAVNEAKELGGIHNSMVTFDHKQFLGQVQDSVIGLYKLTKDSTKLNKLRAMQLFANTTFVPDFSDMSGGTEYGLSKDLVSGRALASLPFPSINYKTTANIYDKAYIPYINYSPTEINVEIENGEIISGVLDGKSISAEVSGSAYQEVTDKFGPEVCLDTIFDHQQIACEFNNITGLSVGIKDVILPAKGKAAVQEVVAKILADAEKVNKMLTEGTLIPPPGMTTEELYEQMSISVLHDDMVDAIMSNIDVNNNTLLDMILSKSKGKYPNLMYILGAVQQRNITGKRVDLKFDRRATPYHMRGDLNPVHRGFVPESYSDGQRSMHIIPDFQKTRKDITDKSITVGESGDMNRNAVKNLDANIIDNLRRVTKGSKIVQQLVGHDGFDSRFQQRTKIGSVMISTEDLRKKAVGGLTMTDEVKKSLKLIEDERKAFVDNFLIIESLNENRPMNNIVPLAVNAGRVFNDMLIEYKDELKTAAKASGKALDSMIATVNEFIDDLPYIYSNEMRRKAKSKVEQRMTSAVKYLGMSIRWELRPTNLAMISSEILDLILQRCMVKLKRSIIAPGLAIGFITAQGICQPMTQGMLQSINKVGGGVGKSISVKSKEVMSARSHDKIKNPAMLIFLKDPFDLAKTKFVANHIEVLHLSNFTAKAPELFLEEYGKPVHPDYIHEIKMFKEYEKYTPRAKPPGDLSKWCIRFELNKVTMLEKNMPLDVIIQSLYDPNIFVIHNDQNSDQIVLRAYFRNNILRKGVAGLDEIGASIIGESMMRTVIRGIPGIVRTEIVEGINQTYVKADGSLDTRLVNAISTIGVNIPLTAMHPDIDEMLIRTDSIDATFLNYGIVAAEMKIIAEIRSMLDGLSYKHYQHYASEMTLTGKVTPMQRAGVAARDPHNIPLQLSHAAPVKVLETAAVHSINCKITGISGPIMVGGMPRVGSTYNQLCINTEFVMNHKTSVDNVLDSL
jgi:DNA-directed RNA polymerase II subunit RPB1